MAYKTKAEKRAFKAGLFAGLKGKKRIRKKSSPKKRLRERKNSFRYYHIGTIEYDKKGRPSGGDSFVVEAKSETEARNKAVNVINLDPKYRNHKIDYVDPE